MLHFIEEVYDKLINSLRCLANEHEAFLFVDISGFQFYCFPGKATSSFNRPNMYRESPTYKLVSVTKAHL